MGIGGQLFLLLLVCTVCCASISPEEYQERKQLEDEFATLYEDAWQQKKMGRSLTSERQDRLQWFLDTYRMPTAYQGISFPYLPEPYIELTCNLCHFAITTVLNKYNTGASKEELIEYVVGLCVNFNFEPEPVCRGAVELNVDSILYVVNNSNVAVNSDSICGVLLQVQCPFEDSSFEWSIDLSPYGEKPPVKPFVPSNDTSMKIVQLTDIHYDRKYVVGSNAACKSPECCWAGSDPPVSEADKAGYWGDYRSCDLPWHAVQSMFQHAAEAQKDAEYIIMTGDLVDHGVWATSVDTNIEVINKVTQELKETFGDKPVFPILGNHESSPLNVFAPVNIEDETVSSNWVYKTAAEAWKPWLTDEARATVLKGGYYTMLAKPGLRIVALHNIVCYTFNWWVLYNPSDQDGQLLWLAQTLAEAEKNNEKVHILAHVPTGSRECFKVWSREFRRIINRFENTVVAQFTGHTHREEWHLYYDMDEPTRATSISFVGGSGTSYSDVNPNYRVYYIDGAGPNPSWAVVDYESWIYNMTAANLQADPKNPGWFKLYSFREKFGVDAMTTTRLEKLTHEMLEDENLLKSYYRTYVKEGDPFLAEGCDTQCLRDLLCEIVTNQPDDPTQCQQLGLTSKIVK